MPHDLSPSGALPADLRAILKSGCVPETEGGLIHVFEQRGYSLRLSGPDTQLRNSRYRWMVTLRHQDSLSDIETSYGASALLALAKAYAMITPPDTPLD